MLSSNGAENKKFKKYWCGKHLAASALMMCIHSGGASGIGNKFNRIWRQILRQKGIWYNGPKHIPIICHLFDPPTFSLPTTFNGGRE
jgi:hypothetical protein